MPTIGTPFTPTATKVLLCGAGELGKEVVIELKRLGVEVIACDRYPNAPAMQVADRAYSFSMLDGAELRRVIELERPDYIVPEIEAIATDTLVELESEGFTVIPTARAARLTMNREGIRRLVAEELGIPTSPYRFADTRGGLRGGRGRDRPALRRQAHHELLRQGPEPGAHRRTRSARPGTTPKPAGAPAAGGSSSRDSSTSTTRSPCSRSATGTGPPSASRSATARRTATTGSPGSPSP